jgi:hypothetical protein
LAPEYSANGDLLPNVWAENPDLLQCSIAAHLGSSFLR